MKRPERDEELKEGRVKSGAALGVRGKVRRGITEKTDGEGKADHSTSCKWRDRDSPWTDPDGVCARE